MGDEGGAQADDGAVETNDEDLGVLAESISHIEVEGNKRLQPELVGIVGVVGLGSRDGNIGTAEQRLSLANKAQREKRA